ncbi:hypothetical protein KM043_002898 [Ampulex compressa]|nr:hypothetical protein KM043_002898 [Ampulex compressa]
MVSFKKSNDPGSRNIASVKGGEKKVVELPVGQDREVRLMKLREQTSRHHRSLFLISDKFPRDSRVNLSEYAESNGPSIRVLSAEECTPRIALNTLWFKDTPTATPQLMAPVSDALLALEYFDAPRNKKAAGAGDPDLRRNVLNGSLMAPYLLSG